ncbi:MAG: alpha/beta hydrolase [Defluviitaleaceae bacterium]|nr:alpha/beta hydrolase [Defluviitaleaceae bacterium]
MPHLQHDGKKIHYEVHGEGQPLIILNGIMMSTASWQMFLPELTQNNQVILLDFFDQGQSDKLNEAYTQAVQVAVVKTVVDHLKLETFHLLGISYGGAVALQFALAHKSRIRRLMIFNTTPYTSPWLADIGDGWAQAAQLRHKALFYNMTIPIIYSPDFYVKNVDWMNERKELLYRIFTDEFFDGVIRLIDSARSHDVRARLPELSGVETLVVGSDYDFVTPDLDQRYIHEQISGSTWVLLENCGHASMYEQPSAFTTLIKDFLIKASGVAKNE